MKLKNVNKSWLDLLDIGVSESSRSRLRGTCTLWTELRVIDDAGEAKRREARHSDLS